MVRDQHTRDVAAKERALKRRMLGCCPCGRAPGADVCPVCDLGVPEVLVAEPAHVVAMREATKALAKAMRAELPAVRAPNRFERRRAAAQRRNGR
jgi:hypothetical protein